MRTLLLAGALAATTTFAPMGARAQDGAVQDTNRQDVRCFIGMAVMSRNETYKSWGALGMFFYAGRVEGRAPGFDLADAVKREVRAIPPADYNDLIKECSDKLGEKSRTLEAMKPPAPRGVGR